MSDEIDIQEEKPKRKYIRKALFGDAMDSAIESAADEAIDAADDDVEEIEVEKPLRFLGEEPIGTSVKSKIIRKLGLNKTMEFKPWKKIDHWVCCRCKWSTFDAKRAKRHSCD